jgi:hypothetical protein
MKLLMSLLILSGPQDPGNFLTILLNIYPIKKQLVPNLKQSTRSRILLLTAGL